MSNLVLKICASLSNLTIGDALLLIRALQLVDVLDARGFVFVCLSVCFSLWILQTGAQSTFSGNPDSGPPRAPMLVVVVVVVVAQIQD